MGTNKVVRSACGLCNAGCGVLVHLDNGRVIKVEGDPDNPVSKGALCAKGLTSLEYLYHPDRLKHPLKRVGKRGGGEWQQISWDEALNVIARELIKARKNYGAESVALLAGHSKGHKDAYFARFANAFGTPNVAYQGHVCHIPRQFGCDITCGFFPGPDYESLPACSVVWGSNQAATAPPAYKKCLRAIERGTKLIVVDPRQTGLARRADLWLQLRPGSDLALALGMINVIINEELFDRDFVHNWTIGFDELRAHIQSYPPEKVEEITWVDRQVIREAARLYATNKPACIQLGNATDHNVNSFQTARAISILRAITGNLSVPGGDLQWTPLAMVHRYSPELKLEKLMTAAKWERRVGADLKIIPIFRRVLPQSVIKAILEGEPYPIHVVYILGCNALLSYSNAQAAYRALNKLNFLVVADMFMTPTAALADIVLPVATYLEFDDVRQASPNFPRAQVQRKVTEVGECWSDLKILNELAKKVGLGKYFWDDEEQCFDAILKPERLTFKKFKKLGRISGSKQYRRFEVDGFQTPSGKVELYSSRLRDWGYDPLPKYYELPETPYTDPELAKEYPLIFTSWKSAPFFHSGGRQISTLRRSHPEPLVHIHPETAGKLGIGESDLVYVETKRGRIKQKATLTTTLDPRVVGVDYGWWFPEKGSSDLYGWAESNINILTDDRPPYSREMGSSNLRGILCKIYKA